MVDDSVHIPRRPTSGREGAEQWLRLITETADRVQIADRLKGDDIEKVPRFKKLLETSWEELTSTIDMVTSHSPSTADHLYHSIWGLISAASLLATRTTVSASALAYAAREQATTARARRAVKSEEMQSRLRRAIEASTSGVALVNSEKFAESIRDQVRGELGGGGDWPSSTTIRRAIGAMLKERDDQTGQS